MELTQKATDYFKGIGVNPETFIQLMDSENTEIDVEKAVSDFKKVSKELYRPGFEEEFKTRQGVEFGKSRIKFMRDINKTHDLGLTSDEIQALKYDEFLDKTKEIITGRNKDFSTEEMTAKIKEITDKFETSSTAMKSDFEAKISESETTLSKYIAKNEFLTKWNGKKIGVSDAQKDFYRDSLFEKYNKSYKILEGGEIQNTDGTPVMNPEGNGIWSTIDDALNHDLKALDILKKSGGSETGGGRNSGVHVNTGGGEDTNVSKAASSLAERARAAGVDV